MKFEAIERAYRRGLKEPDIGGCLGFWAMDHGQEILEVLKAVKKVLEEGASVESLREVWIQEGMNGK